jgi:hypothetical protein
VKAISYLLELTTKVPITLDEQSLKEGKSFYEVVLDKAHRVINTLDLNDRTYQVKVVSEVKEGEVGE